MLACMVVLIVTARTVEKSNSSVAEYDTKSKTELTNDAAALTEYIKSLTAYAADNSFVKVNMHTDISVDDSLVKVSGADGGESEKDKNLVVYAKNSMLPAVDSYYGEDFYGVFGTVYERMPVIDLPLRAVKSARFSQGEADANGNPVYSTDTGELIDADYYFITLDIDCAKAEYVSVSKLFSLEESSMIADKFAADMSDVLSVQSSESNLTGLCINAKINRLTDEIEYINFEKVYTISADVDFTGELEIFGSKHIEFEYKVNGRYEYSYAGIRFSESAVTVEPGDEASLSVNAVIEDDSEYTVTFTSSDSSVATVDEMGYIKGIKASDKPVTVTVILEYLGEKFTDECIINVGSADESDG